MYVVHRMEDVQCVAMIRGLSPSDIELFDLRLLLMNHLSSCYEGARTFNGKECDTYREMVTASGLLADGTEFDITSQEPVQIYSTLRMVVTLFEQSADADKVAVENW